MPPRKRPFNPFRSEADAFRLAIGVALVFGAVAVASVVGGVWYGVGVLLFLGALATGGLLQYGRAPEPVPQAPRRAEGTGEHRVLVVANETVAGRALREAVLNMTAGRPSRVLVVCPALNSPLRHWTSDEDRARERAQARLDESLAHLAEHRIEATGEVGDSDPLQAMEDALRTFGADEIVISTHPEGRSNWLERGVVTAARERFALPITHVVVDLAAEAKETEAR